MFRAGFPTWGARIPGGCEMALQTKRENILLLYCMHVETIRHTLEDFLYRNAPATVRYLDFHAAQFRNLSNGGLKVGL